MVVERYECCGCSSSGGEVLVVWYDFLVGSISSLLVHVYTELLMFEGDCRIWYCYLFPEPAQVIAIIVCLRRFPTNSHKTN